MFLIKWLQFRAIWFFFVVFSNLFDSDRRSGAIANHVRVSGRLWNKLEKWISLGTVWIERSTPTNTRLMSNRYLWWWILHDHRKRSSQWLTQENQPNPTQSEIRLWYLNIWRTRAGVILSSFLRFGQTITANVLWTIANHDGKASCSKFKNLPQLLL